MSTSLNYGGPLVARATMSCAACLATFAATTDTGRIVCDSCSATFARWRSNSHWKNIREATADNAFNSWLAHQLELSARRLAKYGVTGRCEALVSDVQCGNRASRKRDGRPVCWAHGTKSVAVAYTGDRLIDPYARLADVVARLAFREPKLLQYLRTAMQPEEVA